jgi:hypothetical protein
MGSRQKKSKSLFSEQPIAPPPQAALAREERSAMEADMPPDTFQTAQALLAFERQYAQADARMKQLAIRLEGMAHSLREWLSENELDKSKRALYPFLFPGMNVDDLLGKLLDEQSFESWHEEFQAES